MRRISLVLAGASVAAVLVVAACGDDDATSPDGTDASVSPDASVDARPATSDGGADASADADTPFVPKAYDVNHVLGTGQSLSVGSQGTPPLSTTQPFDNTMFNTGPIAGGANLTSFVPLVEGPTVETLSSAFADEVASLAGALPHAMLVSGHGIGGRPYSAIKKGGTEPAYSNGMAQLDAGHGLAGEGGKTYVVRAVTNVHGESDHQLANAQYKEDLLEFQSDYEADVKAVTAQVEPVPMFVTQFSSWTRLSGDKVHDLINGQMLAAHVAAPGKVILVGAKYHLPHVADGVHLTNKGYQHLGEDYAKAYRRVILQGKVWEPLRPKQVTRAGKVITIRFHVPAPPLVLDTTRVTDPGSYGFEFAQTGPAIAIESVALAGPDSVTVTLASAPAGTNMRIRYAYTGVPNALGGPTTGPRGNLRDSDATPSRLGYELFNWCIHFDEAVP